jgi:hypothetical protein
MHDRHRVLDRRPTIQVMSCSVISGLAAPSPAGGVQDGAAPVEFVVDRSSSS